MGADPTVSPARSYGCTFGCGNPYDYIVVNVQDGSTDFLCLPCFVRLATDMVAAVTDPDDPKVKAAMAEAEALAIAPMAVPFIPPRGRNAPATTDDDDLIEAYSGVITVDELPEEFK